MRVFLNPGHDLVYDSGAVNQDRGLRECDIAHDIGMLVAHIWKRPAAKCGCSRATT